MLISARLFEFPNVIPVTKRMNTKIFGATGNSGLIFFFFFFTEKDALKYFSKRVRPDNYNS